MARILQEQVFQLENGDPTQFGQILGHTELRHFKHQARMGEANLSELHAPQAFWAGLAIALGLGTYLESVRMQIEIDRANDQAAQARLREQANSQTIARHSAPQTTSRQVPSYNALRTAQRYGQHDKAHQIEKALRYSSHNE